MMMHFKGEKSPAYDIHSTNMSSFILKTISTMYFFTYWSVKIKQVCKAFLDLIIWEGTFYFDMKSIYIVFISD